MAARDIAAAEKPEREPPPEPPKPDRAKEYRREPPPYPDTIVPPVQWPQPKPPPKE